MYHIDSLRVTTHSRGYQIIVVGQKWSEVTLAGKIIFSYRRYTNTKLKYSVYRSLEFPLSRIVQVWRKAESTN